MRFYTLASILLVLIVLLGSTPSRAAPAEAPTQAADAELRDQADGEFRVLAVSGDHVYALRGQRVVELSLADRAAPRPTGRELWLPATARQIVAAPAYVYVLLSDGSLVSVSLGPGSLAAASRLEGLSGTELGIGAGLAFAYSAEQLELIDLSDPARPALAARLPVPGGVAGRPALAGGYAYVAGPDCSVRLFDLRDPRRPAAAGSLARSSPGGQGMPSDLVAAGGHLYALICGQLEVFSLADPARPARRSAITQRQYIQFDLVGSTAYLTWQETREECGKNGCEQYPVYGIDAVSLADPAQPGQPGATGWDWPMRLLALDATTALVDPPKIQVYSFATPTSPRLLGAYQPIRHERAAAADGVVFTAGADGLLRALRPGPDGRLERVGSLPLPRPVLDIQVGAGYLGALSNGNAVYAVDVRDPARMRVTGSFAIEGDAFSRMVVSGRYAYLSTLSAFYTVDLSAPQRTGRLPFAGADDSSYINAFAIVGGYAYILDGITRDITIFRLDDPLQPTRAGAVMPPGLTAGITAAGGFLLADGLEANTVLSLENPALPRSVGSWPEAAEGALVRGRLLYTGSAEATRVHAIARDGSVVEVGQVAMPAPLAVDGERAYSITRGMLEHYQLQLGAAVSVGPAGGALSSALDATSYSVPAGAFAAPTSVEHQVWLADGPPAGPLQRTGHVFSLSLGARPAEPLRVTVRLDAAERSGIVAESLALYRWDGAGWVRVAGSTVDAAGTVGAPLSEGGLYAVFGAPLMRLYLPQHG